MRQCEHCGMYIQEGLENMELGEYYCSVNCAYRHTGDEDVLKRDDIFYNDFDERFAFIAVLAEKPKRRKMTVYFVHPQVFFDYFDSNLESLPFFARVYAETFDYAVSELYTRMNELGAPFNFKPDIHPMKSATLQNSRKESIDHAVSAFDPEFRTDEVKFRAWADENRPKLIGTKRL